MLRFITLLLFSLLTTTLYSQELSLSARLSQPDGSPLEGVVDLRFELSYSGAPETVICTKDITGTSLTNGLFQLGLNFSTAECGGSSLSDVLEGVPASEAMLFRVVDVTDPANPRTYPFQSLKAVPLSVRSEVAQTLARNSAVEGQVLRFVGGEWTASNETAEVGTVSEINTGVGLTGGPITGSGTIAIANSGISSAMVADGSLVDADLSATAAIARNKLATGTANYVLVNDGSGVMSEIAILPLTSGGTGATNAAGARSNLGLGNAALRNVGLLAGELLDSGEIPSCAFDEKIRKVVMPVAGFVCESGADATKLALAGGTMSGSINMNANAITNLADPSLAQDAATKAYVDGQIGGGAANQWSESGGNLYRLNGNIGIGTTTPTNAFHLTERDDSWLSGIRMDRSYDSATDYFQMMYDFEGFKLRTMANDPDEAHIIFKPLNVEAMRISENGNVGIGVVSPSVKLDINGQIKIAGGAPGAGKVLTSDAAGLATWVAPATSAIPTGAAGGDLSGSYPNPTIATGAVTYAKTNFADGSIPAAKIGGLGDASSRNIPNCGAGEVLTSDLAFGFICVSDNFTDPSKLPLSGGTMSGPLYLSSIPTLSNQATTKQYVDDLINAEIAGVSQSQWLDNGANIYFNTGNVGVGTTSPTEALEVNGSLKVADLISARNNLDGHQIGQLNIDYHSSGTPFLFSDSGGIKMQSINLRELTTDGSLGLFNFKHSRADGTFAFTVRPGGIEREALRIDGATGNVGIGTTLPSHRLDIDGQIRIRGGAPAAGKILTSDANGVASWQDPAPSGGNGTVTSVTAGSGLTGGTITTSGTIAVNTGVAAGQIPMLDAGAKLPVSTIPTISSAMIGDGQIINADVSASAAIAQSKIANLTTDLAGKVPTSRTIATGNGLLGGGNLTANRTLSVDVGTSANKIVQLDSLGRLPAVNGSLLTNLPPQPVSGPAGGSLTGTYPNPTIADGTIINADISAAAAITRSKIAIGAANRLVINNGTGVMSDAPLIPASRALISDASGIPVASGVTSTQLGFLAGTTSAIQTQLNARFSNGGNSFGNAATLGTNDAQNLNLETSGVARVTVNTAGNVGIGTTAPAAKLDVAGTTKMGTAGTAITAMGGCALGGLTIITNTYRNLTCAGVPATTSIAVTCSAQADFATVGTMLYCRGEGTANTIRCHTSAPNNIAMNYRCMWVMP